MIYPNDITSLKTDISQKIGQKIIVKGSLGRNKYDETQENATYQYTDILTRTVELQVFDGQEYCPIIPPESQCKKKRKAYDIG